MSTESPLRDPWGVALETQLARADEDGHALRERQRRSLAGAEAALAKSPNDPRAYTEVASLYAALQQPEEAIRVLRKGTRACAPDIRMYREYVRLLEVSNRTPEAIAAAREATQRMPERFEMRLKAELLLPVLYESPEELEYYRRRYTDGLSRLSAELKLDTPEQRSQAMSGIGKYLSFYLAYQGRNDRDLQIKYGALVHRIMSANFPEESSSRRMPPVPADGRLRIGYLASSFKAHVSSIKNHVNWLREHDHRHVSLYAYHLSETKDALTEEVSQLCDRFRHLPGDLEEVIAAIREDDLHVLVYLDMGITAITAQLASVRLAPVQCVAWDAPLTTGLPNIDYFLSSELMEPDNAGNHYSEQLVPLPGIGICFRKPVIPRPMLRKTRADFGLRENSTVYLCCQTLSKYLPEYDNVLVEIALRNKAAQFVFLAPDGITGEWFGRRLERAFSKSSLQAAEHCVLLPRCNVLTYWNLNLVADVYLDSMDWSGGVTTFEAIACGLPVVTLPGKYMRGRHSFAILTQLGMTETIARDVHEYVDIAVRLGTDLEWRRTVVQLMADGQPLLYSDTRSVRALEKFFLDIVQRRLDFETC